MRHHGHSARATRCLTFLIWAILGSGLTYQRLVRVRGFKEFLTVNYLEILEFAPTSAITAPVLSPCNGMWTGHCFPLLHPRGRSCLRHSAIFPSCLGGGIALCRQATCCSRRGWQRRRSRTLRCSCQGLRIADRIGTCAMSRPFRLRS